MPFFKKQFTIGAGLALVFGLALSHPAVSASVSLALSTQETLAPKLHQGDLVRLRSGGPLMTVDAITDDQVECVWTGENGETDDARFPAKMLQKF
jgi:uncharacterized protein YodC (DUF2158 family)